MKTHWTRNDFDAIAEVYSPVPLMNAKGKESETPPLHFNSQPPHGRYFAINTKNIFLKRVFLLQKLVMKEGGRRVEIKSLLGKKNNAF